MKKIWKWIGWEWGKYGVMIVMVGNNCEKSEVGDVRCNRDEGK